jgi:Glycosyltransferase family 9 (heptosyltransferase)
VVLFPGALGDAVCLEPTVADLSRARRVTVYARGAGAEVARLYPSRPIVASLDSPEVARLFAPAGDAVLEDRVQRWLAPFDRIVSFTGAGDPVVRGRLARTGRAALAAFPRSPLDVHVCDYLLRHAIDDPRAEAPAPRLVVDVSHPSTRLVRARSEGRRPVLAVHPGAGSAAKRVPLAILEQVCGRWEAAGGVVVSLVGPAEHDRRLRSLGMAISPADVADLAQVIAAADAFVGNDSGPSHVAAAIGVPGVALFVRDDPGTFAPRGKSITSLRVHPGDATHEAIWRLLLPALP